MYNSSVDKITHTIAKSDDGSIQITFVIPRLEINSSKSQVLAELGKETEIPGFRKGMAPASKVEAVISREKIIQQTLVKILPSALAKAIKQENLKLALYPKFELIKAADNSDWEIRATTCLFPEVDLGDYKKIVAGAMRSASIVVPGREPSREGKEQAALKALLESVKVTIPKMLIEEEVQNRLSGLLAKLEKLGVALENYLTSQGKTIESLRADYEKSSREAIILELALSKIGEEQNIKISEEEIKKALETASSVSKQEVSPQQKILIEEILKRRKAVDYLTSLQ